MQALFTPLRILGNTAFLAVILAGSFCISCDNREASGGTEADVAGIGDNAASVSPNLDAALSEYKDVIAGIPSHHLSDPMRYVESARSVPLSLIDARHRFSEDDLAAMYSVMDTEEGNSELRYIAQLIAFTSSRNNEKSIEIIEQYLRRASEIDIAVNDVASRREDIYDRVMGKVLCLEWIGLIGGPSAERVLLQTISEDNPNVASAWIDYLDNGDGKLKGKDKFLDSLRGRAALGLVLCESEDGVRIVEDLYWKEKEKLARDGELYSHWSNELISALVARDYIDDHRLTGWLELYGTEETNYGEMLQPYFYHYLPTSGPNY